MLTPAPNGQCIWKGQVKSACDQTCKPFEYRPPLLFAMGPPPRSVDLKSSIRPACKEDQASRWQAKQAGFAGSLYCHHAAIRIRAALSGLPLIARPVGCLCTACTGDCSIPRIEPMQDSPGGRFLHSYQLGDQPVSTQAPLTSLRPCSHTHMSAAYFVTILSGSTMASKDSHKNPQSYQYKTIVQSNRPMRKRKAGMAG